ncbi:MAG: hypothetical protein WBQ08_07265 [Candidatus Sulfotelmatobacter sp.]
MPSPKKKVASNTALREFALGVEALERFVERDPLRPVHECVFGVLALESDPPIRCPERVHPFAFCLRPSQCLNPKTFFRYKLEARMPPGASRGVRI